MRRSSLAIALLSLVQADAACLMTASCTGSGNTITQGGITYSYCCSGILCSSPSDDCSGSTAAALPPPPSPPPHSPTASQAGCGCSTVYVTLTGAASNNAFLTSHGSGQYTKISATQGGRSVYAYAFGTVRTRSVPLLLGRLQCLARGARPHVAGGRAAELLCWSQQRQHALPRGRLVAVL